MPVKLQLPLRPRRRTAPSLPLSPIRNKNDGIDSLTWVSQPPPDETKEDKKQRLINEQAAKKRSEDIDKFLREQASKAEKEREGQKTILLLGQAEAGKTTVLKQMRLLYAPERHEQHRSSWRLVIQLNVIAAVRLLLDIHEALAERDSQQRKRHLEDEDGSVTPVGKPHDPVLLARLRLAPLIACEAALRRALGAIDEEEYVQESSATTPASNRMSYSPRPGPTSLSSHALKLKAGWQSRAIPTAVNTRKLNANEIIASESNGSNGAAPRMQVTRRDSLPICVGGDDSDQPTLTSKEQRWRFHDDEAEYSTQHGSTVVYDRARTESMLISMQDDVRALWERNSIRQLKAKGRLPTFMVHFLDQLPRIATARYRPTDQDILQARVRTIGVTEETFRIHTSTYRVIDVGGSRSQRNVWTSFFDQATAIILLAPISAFDQTLAESRHINRLVDSLDILESIVDCRLLSRVSLIIFLNKSDICEKKLLQGVQVSNFFPEYKGPNDFEHVWRWFRQRFRDVVAKHHKTAPNRSVYIHTTVATSTKNIQAILVSVNDALIKENLHTLGLV